jgi:hypothetical protein
MRRRLGATSSPSAEYLGSVPSEGASATGGKLVGDYVYATGWNSCGRSADFPVGTPTRVRFQGHPMAANLKQGERIVVAIGGGSSELEPDARHPLLTVSGGSIRLSVVGAQPLSLAD